jgi:ABC-type transporter Mla subunit MlaD
MEMEHEKMLEIKAKVQDRRQNIVVKHLDQTFKTYNRVLDNVEALSNRVDSRIAKIEANASSSSSLLASTTAAKAENTLAKAKIADARTLLLQIKAQASTTITTIGTTTSTTTIQNKVAAINALFKQARTAIKDAQAQVVKAINALKGPEEKRKDDEKDGENNDDNHHTGTTTASTTVRINEHSND